MDDLERVISTAEAVSGDRAKAIEWPKQPLDSFGGKTSLQLIGEGRTESLIGYIQSFESRFVG